MRKNTLLTSALCALTIFSSCDPNSRPKPLMGGLKGEIEPQTTNETVARRTDKTHTLKREPVSGLEIPAPLEKRNELILKRTGYTVSYNNHTLQPNWVAWCLYEDRCTGPAKRPQKAFHEDDDVPEPRAVDTDYYGSGFDRGHMCPAADNKQNDEMMLQSFLFTNICPQSHGLNVGDWNELENQCRRWAKDYGSIYIVCGPIFYNQKHKTIGKHKIPVPEAFFKVALRTSPDTAAIGFIYKNKDGNRPKGDYVNTVDDVERLTGIDFFPTLPDNVEQAVEATTDLEKWNIE